MFERVKDGRGGHLLCRIEVKTSELAAAFGCADFGTEPEKGYDNSFMFAGPDGCSFKVYDRYGRYRIGGVDYNALPAFIGFIESKVGHPINPVELPHEVERALALAHAQIDADARAAIEAERRES